MTELTDERPGVGTEALEDLRGSTSIVNDSRTYPPKIQLSDSAEAYIAALAVDLMLAKVELHQLPESLMELYTYAYECGRTSRQAALDHVNAVADRLYQEVCRRPAKPFVDPNRPSFAELTRIRGNAKHADRIEAANAHRFAQVYS